MRLSDIELYYTLPESISNETISLTGEEFKHSVKVMRNGIGDIIYITNGDGVIFKSEIIFINRNQLSAKIIGTYKNENKFKNVCFCIPKLKNPDRFKFTLEKCVELGVTNFVIFESERTIARGENVKRWEKIILSAMKQSIRAYLPKIKLVKNLAEIAKLPGDKIVFDQNCDNEFRFENLKYSNAYFIFGPEGGLTENELQTFGSESVFSLSSYRLRSETAIIKAASLLK